MDEDSINVMLCDFLKSRGFAATCCHSSSGLPIVRLNDEGGTTLAMVVEITDDQGDVRVKTLGEVAARDLN